MENNITKLREEFSKGMRKYLTKNKHMKIMSDKELLDWIYPKYITTHGIDGIKALLGFTQAYEKGNIFDFEEIEIIGVYNHDIYGTLRDDKGMLPKSSSYTRFYNNDNELNKYKSK